jgi:hypothetical protein
MRNCLNQFFISSFLKAPHQYRAFSQIILPKLTKYKNIIKSLLQIHIGLICLMGPTRRRARGPIEPTNNGEVTQWLLLRDMGRPSHGLTDHDHRPEN